LEDSRLGVENYVARKDAVARFVEVRHDHELKNLVDYFERSGVRLGVFYPTDHLIGVFRNPAGADFAVHELFNAGFAPSEAIAADGKAVFEFGEADPPVPQGNILPRSRSDRATTRGMAPRRGRSHRARFP
jgi:hypothetical protein